MTPMTGDHKGPHSTQHRPCPYRYNQLAVPVGNPHNSASGPVEQHFHFDGLIVANGLSIRKAHCYGSGGDSEAKAWFKCT